MAGRRKPGGEGTAAVSGQPKPRPQRRKPRRGVTHVRDLCTWAQAADKPRVAGRPNFRPSAAANARVCVWKGNITCLRVGAVVNATNQRCQGGGGVDGAVHRAAGPGLLAECKRLRGCKTGQAKITGGHLLPATHVIHTVGPKGERPEVLRRCYDNVLAVALEHGVRTVCFCCISAGGFGYPPEKAAEVALRAVREALDDPVRCAALDRVVFGCYRDFDYRIYRQLLPLYFPPAPEDASVTVPVREVQASSAGAGVAESKDDAGSGGAEAGAAAVAAVAPASHVEPGVARPATTSGAAPAHQASAVAAPIAQA